MLKLETLDISSNEFRAEGGEVVLKILSNCSTLRELDASSNSMGVVGLKVALEALNIGRALQTVNLARNQPLDFVSEVGFAKVLLLSATLKSVDFSNNRISAGELLEVTKAASQNGFLHALKIDTVDDLLFTNIIQRNKSMHDAARCASLCLLALRLHRETFLSIFPKEIVRMFSDFLWRTRADIVSWGRTVK